MRQFCITVKFKKKKKHRRNSKGAKGSSTKAPKSGVVEIGQDASECGEGSSSKHTKTHFGYSKH